MTSRSIARVATTVVAAALVAGPLTTGAHAAPKPAAPTIVAGPAALTNVRSATFEFTHATAGMTFQCSLDAGAWADCVSPHNYPGPLAEVLHTFKVRGRDTGGTLSQVATATWTVDATAPEAPALAGVPAAATTGTTASIEFSSAEAGVQFLCSLDGTPAAPCTSPYAVSDLDDGDHAFTVAARDGAGNTSPDTVGAWSVDTTAPPVPAVTTGPASVTNDPTATFAVDSPETDAVLSCSLDGAAFAACPAPLVYAGLAEGAHAFEVLATDSLGNVSAAARHEWTVDLTAPTPPAVVSGPAARTTQTAGEFMLDGFDASALWCSLDGAEFAACGPAYSTGPLADGDHTLQVRGVDAASNTSGTTQYAWTVDTTPPPAAAVAGPAALSRSASATFTITNAEDGVTFACALDGGAATACESGVTYTSLADGPHSLVVTAADSVLNTSTTTFAWTVDATAPTRALVAPDTLTAAAAVAFSEPVSGVTPESLAVRVSGTTATLAATLACAGTDGAAVSCATGPVATATLRPAAPLVPGDSYTVLTNPAGAETVADAAGNLLAATTTAFRAQTSLEETTPAARYAWRGVATTKAYGGSYRTERLGGATATFAFSGTSVTWYTVKGRDQGVADVYVDGVKKATVNNYAATTAYRVARTVTGLAAGAHQLRIVVRGVKGSTSGTGTSVAVDAVKAGTTLVATPAFVHTWRTVASTAGGAHAVAELAGEQVTLRFRGTGFTWVTSTGRNRGIAKVYVDGVLKATVDNYAASTAYGVRRTITGLTDARHTVRIVVTGARRKGATGTVVTFDRLVVR